MARPQTYLLTALLMAGCGWAVAPAGAAMPVDARPITTAGASAAAPGAPASPPATPLPPTDSIARRVAACTGCHGAEGRATAHGYFPRIAGKPATYLYHQLLNFREGRRQQALMTYLVDHLSDDYLREMADYFAGLDLPYPPPPLRNLPEPLRRRGEQLVRQGDAAQRIPACASCHGAALTGVEPAIPGLLGLPRDYLAGQIGAWKTGQRRATPPDCMARISAALTPDDVAAVTTWLASQPVPPSARAAAALPATLPLPCGGVP